MGGTVTSSRDRTAAEPVSAATFAALMAALGPYERAPRLAVAVSGGADSMALLLLARDWAAGQGGTVTALTVDHGLRPEAAAEAAQVGRWATAIGVARDTLRWAGPHPVTDIQAAARDARYRLLEERCAALGIFHLLLAHHRGDQAETFLLRLARGSGLDGLAAMSAIVERPQCRLLRPLLSLPRSRLLATLAARGQDWIEDPSNDNPAFARVRMRRAGPVLAAEGLEEARLAATAARLARARDALDRPLARLLARAVVPHPAGFVRIDRDLFVKAPAELALRALAAVLISVGGGRYPPRLDRLERLYRALATGPERGRTLAGCRVLPRRGMLLVCREAAGLAPPVTAVPGEKVLWDRRFRLDLPSNAPSGLSLGALGPGRISGRAPTLPAVVRRSLPALRDAKGVVAVPGLDYVRADAPTLGFASQALLLRATRPATAAGIKVV